MQNPVKKKILILVDWFAPGYKAGGPIQSCVNMAFALKDDHDIHVFTSDRDLGSDAPYEGIVTDKWTTDLDPRIKVYYASKDKLGPKLMEQVIRELDPDIIQLNHLFSPLFVVYPLWLAWRGKIRGTVVLSPRGALYDSALNVKRYKKTPFLALLRLSGMHRRILFHATNQRETDAILRHFPGSRVMIAENLPSARQPEFRSVEKKPGQLKLIFVARIHPIKNLAVLLEAMQGVQAELELTVVGPNEDQAYWERCRSLIAALPSSARVDVKGAVPNHMLGDLIRQHHLFALPTAGENFGHSIFEALLAGRPVLISDQTPWQDLNDKNIGWDLPLQPLSGFTRAITEAASWDQTAFEDHARAAWEFSRNFIRRPELKQNYLSLFHG